MHITKTQSLRGSPAVHLRVRQALRERASGKNQHPAPLVLGQVRAHLVDVSVVHPDTAEGPVGAPSPSVDDDVAPQSGVPRRQRALAVGGHDFVVLRLADEPLFQPSGGVVGILPNCFTIEAPPTKLVLRADDKEDLMMWTVQLRLRIEVWKKKREADKAVPSLSTAAGSS